jgi:hypothetical protein
MRPRLAVVALFLATLAASLWFFGVFTPPERPQDAPATGDPTQPSEDPRLPSEEAEEPVEAPELEVPALAAPVRALILGDDAVASYTGWLTQLWGFNPKIRWQSWFARPDPKIKSHSDGLPALDQVPGPADLEAVDILVLAAFDPSRLPASMWTTVADRVRAGSLGLLILPNGATGHAIAETEALKPILPVAKVSPHAAVTPGGPVPGVFFEALPIVLTEEGAAHPVTRLVKYPKWNRKMWGWMGEGGPKAAWATKYVSPVEMAAPGAVVLARAGTGPDSIPAIVAGPGELRVLWVGGFFNVDTRAYKESRSVLAMRALMNRWAVWLTSR